MNNIYVGMRKTLIDQLLERRYRGDISVDEKLARLSSPVEDIWMQELFAGKEKNSPSVKYTIPSIEIKQEVIHGYDIETFSRIHFRLKHNYAPSTLEWTEEEIRKDQEAKRKEKEERNRFTRLSLQEKVNYMNENTNDRVTEIGCSQQKLQEYLRNEISQEVRNFLQTILYDYDLLAKVQVVCDGSYYANTVLVRFDKLMITSYEKDLGIKDNNKQKMIENLCKKAKVVSLNLDYQTEEQASSDLFW